MDGVLLDSETIYNRAFGEISKELMPEVTDEKVEDVLIKCLGCSSVDSMDIFRKEFGEDAPCEEVFRRSYARFFEIEKSEGLPVMKGVAETLAELKRRGHVLMLATSTESKIATRQLKTAGLYDFFEKFIFGDEVEHSKPDPDIYIKAAERLGVSTSECAAVEDSYNGIRSAFAAGLKPVMIPDKVQPNEEIKKLLWKQCTCMNELLEIF